MYAVNVSPLLAGARLGCPIRGADCGFDPIVGNAHPTPLYRCAGPWNAARNAPRLPTCRSSLGEALRSALHWSEEHEFHRRPASDQCLATYAKHREYIREPHGALAGFGEQHETAASEPARIPRAGPLTQPAAGCEP